MTGQRNTFLEKLNSYTLYDDKYIVIGRCITRKWQIIINNFRDIK
jgi:hypothetical protein